jgi:primosomal protein N' (replication factor Y)
VGFADPSAIPTKAPEGLELKPLREVLDDSSALGDELWGLARWIGKTFLCGMGEALQLLCPPSLLRGEAIPPRPTLPPKPEEEVFQEISFYHPLDDERFAHYLERLSAGVRALVVFPEAEMSAGFFARLPESVKENALLWPFQGGKKLWDAWTRTASGEVRVVVGSQGAAFAPSSFEEFIVDDESNPAYVFQRAPRISARSLIGRRALVSKARLLLGGRMPSAKTYLRAQPKCELLPNRKNLIFVDMGRSFKNEVRGVEGTLPVTSALVDRTRATLEGGSHVLWIMDRKGQAGEIFCSDCGETFACSRCGATMRSESGGNGEMILRCVRCGAREALPGQCPACRGALLLGKRPGLEALLPLALRYVRGHRVLLDGTDKSGTKKNPNTPSLVLGTRRILSLCDSLDVGLAAWLDLDAEARSIEYNARFQAFSMVWESYWRGQRGNRIVLAQTRRPGSAWQRAFWLGWEHFWKEELRERKSLNLPPHELLVQVDFPEKRGAVRSSLLETLEKENIFALDSGGPLWITAKSTKRLGAVLAPRFEIKHSRQGFPTITVWVE